MMIAWQSMSLDLEKQKEGDVIGLFVVLFYHQLVNRYNNDCGECINEIDRLGVTRECEYVIKYRK